MKGLHSVIDIIVKKAIASVITPWSEKASTYMEAPMAIAILASRPPFVLGAIVMSPAVNIETVSYGPCLLKESHQVWLS